MVKGRDVVIIKEIGDLLPPACRIATSAMRKRQPRPTLFTFSSINIVVNINTLVRDKTHAHSRTEVNNAPKDFLES